MKNEEQTQEQTAGQYLLIHTIDTLTRAYQAFMHNKDENAAKSASEKITELVGKIKVPAI